MRSWLGRIRRKAAQKGQGMTEYIIIVAVVAILSLAIVIKFGDTIRMWFTAAGEQMAGEDTTDIENQMDSNFKRDMDDL